MNKFAVGEKTVKRNRKITFKLSICGKHREERTIHLKVSV